MNWRPTRHGTRSARLGAALALVVIATAIVVFELFPPGPVLMLLPYGHGIEGGDLPAIALYLVAALLALWP